MRRREFCLGLVAMPALARQSMAQETNSLLFGKQFGLPYLPLMVMEEFRLVENMPESWALRPSRPNTRRWAERRRWSTR